MKLKHIEKENKGKEIKEIKISYQAPALPEKTDNIPAILSFMSDKSEVEILNMSTIEVLNVFFCFRSL